LATISEVVPIPNTGNQGTRRGRANPAQLQQPTATIIFTSNLADCSIKLYQAVLDMAGVL